MERVRGVAFDTESSGKRERGKEGGREGTEAAVGDNEEEEEEGEGDKCKQGLSEPDNCSRFRSSCCSHELKEAGRGREGCCSIAAEHDEASYLGRRRGGFGRSTFFCRMSSIRTMMLAWGAGEGSFVGFVACGSITPSTFDTRGRRSRRVGGWLS